MRKGSAAVIFGFAMIAVLVGGWMSSGAKFSSLYAHISSSVDHLLGMANLQDRGDERVEGLSSGGKTARPASVGPRGVQPARHARAETAAPVGVEVARIDPEGVSVIAGRAPAHSHVSIRVDGKEVATAVASAYGQWSVVVSSGLRSGRLVLSAIASPAGGGAVLASPVATVDVPEGGGAATVSSGFAPGLQSRAFSSEMSESRPAAHMAEADRESRHDLERFRVIVQQARAAELAKVARADGATAATSSLDGQKAGEAGTSGQAQASGVASPGVLAEGSERHRSALGGPKPDDAAAGASSSVARGAAAPSVPFREDGRHVPVPITFETDTTAMTPVGIEAASLLAEYLKIKHPHGITLTGHADARGTDAYNFDLSRRRLVAIEHYLRDKGYSGGLVLVPKGKSEPYRWIDRKAASREDVWQADRRVELRFIR
ncbi:MAG: OmpA family protein [Hyphomicrobiaceae bacterium]